MKKLETKQEINDLLSAPAAFAALDTAIEKELFWLLDDNPLKADDIARILGIPLRRCHYWLNILKTMGMLDLDMHGYSPSALTRSAILETYLKGSWKHLALDQRERSDGVHNLALYIQEPGSIWAAQGMIGPRDYVEKMRQDPARGREFTRTLYEVHQYLGKELADILNMNGVHRLLDVGGGSGVVSMALLDKYPGLTVTVIDLENVCVAGREIARKKKHDQSMTFLPVNFEDSEFPVGFDMVLKCDVSVFREDFFVNSGVP
jgi:hypothetical protein